jgi:hypothetical protein
LINYCFKSECKDTNNFGYGKIISPFLVRGGLMGFVYQPFATAFFQSIC